LLQQDDLGFESLDPLRLLGDEHIGVEQLTDQLDEKLEGVVGCHRNAPFRKDAEGGHPREGVTALRREGQLALRRR
jgi:hypothetical protein